MMELEMARLDHFGLVAGVFDQLGISDVVDNCLPKSRHHKLSHSQVLKAMVINGLGFVGQRLYLFPSFFENLPTDKLLGEGVVEQISMMMSWEGHLMRYTNMTQPIYLTK
jgi:transposase